MADPLSIPCPTCGVTAGPCESEFGSELSYIHGPRTGAAEGRAALRASVLAEVEAMLVEERDAGASIGRALVRLAAMKGGA